MVVVLLPLPLPPLLQPKLQWLNERPVGGGGDRILCTFGAVKSQRRVGRHHLHLRRCALPVQQQQLSSSKFGGNGSKFGAGKQVA